MQLDTSSPRQGVVHEDKELEVAVQVLADHSNDMSSSSIVPKKTKTTTKVRSVTAEMNT